MSVSKKAFYFFSFLLFLLLLISCNKDEDESVTKNFPEEFEWLKTWGNYKDSSYQEVYEKALNKYLAEEDYEKTAYILAAKGNVLDYNLVLDTIYLEQCLDFIGKYGKSISDNSNLEIRYFIGSQLDFNNEVIKSEKWLLDAIRYASKPKESKLVGFSYMIMASQQKIKSQLDTAQIYAYRALEIFENNKDTANIGMMQYNLFRIATSLGDNQAADMALKKMLSFAKIARDTHNICFSYTSYALNAANTDTTFNQIKLYTDSLKNIIDLWSYPVSHYKFMASYLSGLYSTHFGNVEQSLAAINDCEKYINLSDRYHTYYLKNLKLLYSFSFNESFDERLFNEMIEETKSKKDYYRGVKLLGSMVFYKEERKDYREAYIYLNEKIALRDSLWNKDLKSKIIEFEKKYETAKKEQKIAEQKQVISERNTQLISLASFILTAILAFIIYLNYRKRLAIKKEQALQEQFTQDLLQNTEDERSRIAGDLHDSVNNYLLQLSNKVKEGKNINYFEINEAINSIRNISHDLFPAMFENVGLELSIKNLCQKMMENSTLKISAQIQYENKVGTKQELQIYRIIQEALNNIIKHSMATHAFVKVVSNEDTLEVSIKDNGKGFNPEDKKGSFGITNMQQRAKSIQANINIDSNEKGTQLLLKRIF